MISSHRLLTPTRARLARPPAELADESSAPDTQPSVDFSLASDLNDRFHHELSQLVPRVAYRLWLADLSLKARDGDAVDVVVAPSRLRWVTERYSEVIIRACERATGSAPRAIRSDTSLGDDSASATPPAHRPHDSLALPRDPDLTFETFVVHEGSRVAHAAALALAECSDTPFSILLLTGPTGCGKSHLLNAIEHLAASPAANTTVLLTNSDHLTRTVATAARKRRVSDFATLLGSFDLVLLDDAHTLAGRPTTLTVIAELARSCATRAKRLVLAATSDSDNPPLALSLPDTSLLHVELSPPEPPAHVPILEQLARRLGVDLPPQALKRIAEISSPIPSSLAHSLLRVSAYASLRGEPPTPELVDRVLDRIPPADTPQPDSPTELLASVARAFSVPLDSLRGRSRAALPSRARAAAALLLRETLRASLPEIGRLLGNRSHTTIIGLLQSAQRLLDSDPQFAHAVASARASLARPEIEPSSPHPPDIDPTVRPTTTQALPTRQPTDSSSELPA